MKKILIFSIVLLAIKPIVAQKIELSGMNTIQTGSLNKYFINGANMGISFEYPVLKYLGVELRTSFENIKDNPNYSYHTETFIDSDVLEYLINEPSTFLFSIAAVELKANAYMLPNKLISPFFSIGTNYNWVYSKYHYPIRVNSSVISSKTVQNKTEARGYSLGIGLRVKLLTHLQVNMLAGKRKIETGDFAFSTNNYDANYYQIGVSYSFRPNKSSTAE